jgi:hypothetical protein
MKKYKFDFNLDFSGAVRRIQNISRGAIHIKTCSLFAVLSSGFLFVPSEARANLIMGNLPAGGGGYTIATEAGNTFGAAVEFTPLSNVAFDSVTLWISGYNGLGGSLLYLSLLGDSSSYGFPFSGPAGTIATGSAAPNNGSDAAFTFNFGGQLSANTPYWLFLYLQVPNGGTGPDYGKFNCYWDGGGTTAGGVIINGSETYADGFSPGSIQSGAPAFSINSVPDATSTASLLALAAGCCLFARHQWRRN